jgi:hypothetical protein
MELVIFKNQFLRLFRLELQLACQLMILKNCQPRGCRQLLLLQREQVRAHVADFGQHFVFQLVRGLHLLSFFIGNLSNPDTFFLFQRSL